MSVSLLVEFKSPEREALHVPVATQAIYGGYWRTAAQKLGLRWFSEIPQASSAPMEDLPAFIAELEQLRAEFARRPTYLGPWFRKPLELPMMHALLMRVDDMLVPLRDLDPAEVSEFSIG